MTGPAPGAYVEPGATWRAWWLLAAALTALLVLDAVVPGERLPSLTAALAVVVALGVVGGGVLAARRTWTVRVTPEGPDPILAVGRERVPLADVDAAHLRAVCAGRAGVDAGAPVLGGGWSLPRGRTGLPLRLAGERTVLVPTRDPAGLRNALLTAVPSSSPAVASEPPEGGVSEATGGREADRGTLGR